MTDKKEVPKHIVTIEIYEDGMSKLIPDTKLSPDYLLDILHQHMRQIERNIVFSDIVMELNKKKIILPREIN